MCALRCAALTWYTSAMKFRYSMPLSRSYRSLPSGTKPISRWASSRFSFSLWPAMVMVPASGRRMPVISLMVVVLPAPLGPMKPNSSPPFTCSVRSSTALKPFLA